LSRTFQTDPDRIRAVRRSAGRMPRIRARTARPGRAHPASPADIMRLLCDLGEFFHYGIEAIDLMPGHTERARLRLGALKVPGRIVLYDQPLSPWLVPGQLNACDERRIRRHGALVEPVLGGIRVEWPEDALRDFMLFDVLLHEIGHHVLQHYAGKRTVRAARTRDHEAFAIRFAARSRRLRARAKSA